MTNVIAKIRCSGIDSSTGNYNKKQVIARNLKFEFVYHNDDENHENRKFWDATPSGELSMYVQNPEAADQIEVGTEYYLIITSEKPPGI